MIKRRIVVAGLLVIMFCVVNINISYGEKKWFKVTVSSQVNFPQENVPIEITLPVSRDIDIYSVKVLDAKGSSIARQVETQYDDPNTDKLELVILWQVEQLLGRERFTIEYSTGTKTSPPSFKFPDEEMEFQGNKLINSKIELVLGARKSKIYGLNILWPQSLTFNSEKGAIRLMHKGGGSICYLEGKNFKDIKVKVLEQGPIRYRIYAEGKCTAENWPVSWKRWVNIYANRPEVYYQCSWKNNTDTEIKGVGDPPSLISWHPTPGGEMSTAEEDKGKDYIALVPRGKSKVEVTKLRNLPKSPSCVKRADSLERWYDLFDTEVNSSGIGIIYPEQKYTSIHISNYAYYSSEAVSKDLITYPHNYKLFHYLSEFRLIGPKEEKKLNFYLYPHDGDYKATQNFWYTLKDKNEVIAEEAKVKEEILL